MTHSFFKSTLLVTTILVTSQVWASEHAVQDSINYQAELAQKRAAARANAEAAEATKTVVVLGRRSTAAHPLSPNELFDVYEYAESTCPDREFAACERVKQEAMTIAAGLPITLSLKASGEACQAIAGSKDINAWKYCSVLHDLAVGNAAKAGPHVFSALAATEILSVTKHFEGGQETDGSWSGSVHEIVSITALTDLTITAISGNRGNCAPSSETNISLKLGESVNGGIGCQSTL